MYKTLVSVLLLASSLSAVETTMTSISFVQDDNGNLNPAIYIPVYYGKSNQFFSAVGYKSSTLNETSTLDPTIYPDSKTSLVSNDITLDINYISYIIPYNEYSFSFGLKSTFKQIENTEFAYFQSASHYGAFDSYTEIDVQIHSLEFQALVPLASYLNSRLTLNVSPYTVIDVKQTTTTKYENIDLTNTNKDSSTQDLAYSAKYELQTKTDFLVNLGLTASYSNQPLKYEAVANTKVDSNEITQVYLAKLIFNKKFMGGLNPSVGYGIEYLDIKNNLDGTTTSTDRAVFTLGLEKRF